MTKQIINFNNRLKFNIHIKLFWIFWILYLTSVNIHGFVYKIRLKIEPTYMIRLNRWYNIIQWLLILLLWIIALCGMWGDYWLYCIIQTPLNMGLGLDGNHINEYMIIVEQIGSHGTKGLTRLYAYHDIAKKFHISIPTIMGLDKPEVFIPRAHECEQLLTNMECLQQLKTSYSEFSRYYFVPINSEKWNYIIQEHQRLNNTPKNTWGGADAVLYDSCAHTYQKWQLKFFIADLDKKSRTICTDLLKYQKTTDVLEITLNNTTGFDQFITNLRKQHWMFEAWIQTYSGIFDQNTLEQAIQTHANYLCIGKNDNYTRINDICRKNFENIINNQQPVQAEVNWTVLDALKEVKFANSVKSGQQFCHVPRNGGHILE